MKYRTYWTECASGWHLMYSPGDEFPAELGKIADFAVWSRVLTPEEIIALQGGSNYDAALVLGM